MKKIDLVHTAIIVVALMFGILLIYAAPAFANLLAKCGPLSTKKES